MKRVQSQSTLLAALVASLSILTLCCVDSLGRVQTLPEGVPSQAAVLGAAGGIGQPLSLLLKLNPQVSALSCFDVAPFTPGAHHHACRCQ
eukprot:1029369-Amphidinium_carterae.1